MASLSLPRVLQLKKNSLEAEREHFEKFQTLAIQKAINTIETPVKEKHVRSTIIGTFQDQSAVTYWMVAIRLPLQDNRIAAWKFCHVTHKLLREGHPACLDDSQRHIGMIDNLGKLWVHLREGYGKLVHLYCNLLVCKLKFHARNPRFPGNMQLTADELDNIAENDVNNYFQLCVELFDYMDEILNLQAAVFDSVGNARANSMTGSGQCRLAALIPCAQDSSHIYDCNVRLLFRLHASLPADTLAGHRDRFRQQFKKLSSFYKHASSLQYYRNLLTLPLLPSNPPNFLLQSDFGTYVAPVVLIPEPPPDEVDAVGALVDTSDTISQATSPDNFDTRTTPSPQSDPLVERDRLIDHLQNELKRIRNEVSQMVQERNNMLSSMREHCSSLESQIQVTRIELDEEKQRAEVLSAQMPEIKQKLSETEEKARVTDEKFQKLKGAYTQLREEHITLIRQKAEVDKLAASLRAAAAQYESTKMALQQQLNDKTKDMELLQQSASSTEEIEAYKNEITNLRTELETSRQKDVELEKLRASMEQMEIEHKTAAAEQNEQLTTTTNELREALDSLEKVTKENSDLKKNIEEKEAAVKQISELKIQYEQDKEDLLQHNTALEADLSTVNIQLDDARKELSIQRSKVVSCVGDAMVKVIDEALGVVERANSQDNNRVTLEHAIAALENLSRYTEIQGNEEAIAASTIFAGHNAAQLAVYITEVSNTSTDMQVSDELMRECRSMLTVSGECVRRVREGAEWRDACAAASGALRAANAAGERVRAQQPLAHVDDELADMDRAVQEAAQRIQEMLEASRAADSGVKLEVNGRILESCTSLMAAVKILVQEARSLQNELGDPKTRQRMYRRNPQWSDGLISAAKAVVFAAKLLVSSADEAVGSLGRVEGVCAAAHEVGGSTAQLVAASRARAPPSAPALARLTAASRQVAAATGAVLGDVRAAAALLHNHEALDTSTLTLTATRRLEMESKVRALELENALEKERVKLAALRKHHYQLAQQEENGNMTNGKSLIVP